TFFDHASDKWTTPPATNSPPQLGHHPVVGLIYGVPEIRFAYLAMTEGLGCYDFPSDVLQGGNYQPSEPTALNDSASNYLRSFEAIANDLSKIEDFKEIIAGLRQVN